MRILNWLGQRPRIRVVLSRQRPSKARTRLSFLKSEGPSRLCQSSFMKHHKSTADLVTLLADERGLAIEDRERAVETLRRINYYRFTGYARHFQEHPAAGKNDYQEDASFDQIVKLIERDDELRLRLMIPLSTVEQSVRTRFAHVAGREFGCQAFYLDASKHISDSPDVLNRIRRVKEDLQSSQHPTIAHYRRGDDVSDVPVWVAVEVLSFGKIAWLIESLDSVAMREELADFFSYTRNTFPRTLQSLSARSSPVEWCNRFVILQGCGG